MSIVEFDGPPHLTRGHFVLSPASFARIKRPRWRPVGLDNRHLRSHGKTGDCEPSSVSSTACYVDQGHEMSKYLASP